MVAFDSTIIIREAGGYHRPTILAMSLLGGLITPDYLDKEGTDFRVHPLGEGNPGCASEKYEGDEGWINKIREIIKDMPLYPIQLFSNAEDLAKWFKEKFVIGLDLKEIRFLENIK